MILYDSHRCFTFCQLRGSIFPQAFFYAIPSALFAWAISEYRLFDLKHMDKLQNGTIYSGFTFVLGFILVFRTSQSYSRYWLAATAVHRMRAEWCDACGSLIAFVQTSKQSEERCTTFTHTIVRLFGLMHAMALEEIASLEDENFPLLDIAGLDKEDLRVLTSELAQGRKVEIVLQWIKVCMMRASDSGVLSVPAPILTRVFQELGTGMIHYHEALQVVIWPFPFPYAQMSTVLIWVYMAVTPIVINLWAAHAWYCAVATLISVICMKGIDIIAIELENPFGDDPNDLPSFQMHHAMNRDLTLLVNPKTWCIPRLLPTAKLTYDELVSMNKEDRMSLAQYYERQEARTPFKRLKTMVADWDPKLGLPSTPTKASVQRDWVDQSWGTRQARVERVLNLDERERVFKNLEKVREVTTKAIIGRRRLSWTRENLDEVEELPPKALDIEAPEDDAFCLRKAAATPSDSDVESSSDAGDRPTALKMNSTAKEGHRGCERLGGASRADRRPPEGPPPWHDFLGDLAAELKEHLQQQIRHQEAIYERHLLAAADAVCERRILEHAREELPSQDIGDRSIELYHGHHGLGDPRNLV